MIVATQNLINIKKEINYDIVADIKRLGKLKKHLLQTNKNDLIKIYDLGRVQNNKEKIVSVKDHINKTGINPIINNLKIEFKDISNIYNTKLGITTTCCGKELNVKHSNPSHFLCIISIYIYFLGFNNIQAFIVNS